MDYSLRKVDALKHALMDTDKRVLNAFRTANLVSISKDQSARPVREDALLALIRHSVLPVKKMSTATSCVLLPSSMTLRN